MAGIRRRKMKMAGRLVGFTPAEDGTWPVGQREIRRSAVEIRRGGEAMEKDKEVNVSMVV